MVNYPEDWKISQIDKIANITTGCRDLKDSIRNGKYPFYVRSKEVERINFDDYDCEAVLTAGDGEIGKIFHYINGKFAAHQRVYVISNFEKVDGKYFYYFFSKNFLYEVERYTAKSTVDSVRRPMIANMKIPLPPFKEQQAIASVLSDFDEHINNLTKLIEKKKGIRDGALEDLITGQTRLDGFDGECEEEPLQKICNIYDGIHQTPNYTVSGIKFVSVENISDIYSSDKYISRADYDRDFKVRPEKGDVLMTRIGDIGTSCIVGTSEPIAYYVSLALFKKITIDSEFLNHYIESKEFKNELDDRTLYHATPKKINKGEIGKCKVRYPKNKDEQKAIASILTAMDEEIEALEIEKAKIESIKEGAMYDLLTGRVRL